MSRFTYPGTSYTSDLIEAVPAPGCTRGVTIRVGSVSDVPAALLAVGVNKVLLDLAGVDALMAELAEVRARMAAS